MGVARQLDRIYAVPEAAALESEPEPEGPRRPSPLLPPPAPEAPPPLEPSSGFSVSLYEPPAALRAPPPPIVQTPPRPDVAPPAAPPAALRVAEPLLVEPLLAEPLPLDLPPPEWVLPDDPAEVLPPEVLADLDAPADLEVTDDAAPEDDDGGAAVERVRARKSRRSPRKPRAPLAPCAPPIPEIVATGPESWTIDRGLVEYYATHLRELESIAAVWTHRTDGVPDGFRLGLDRCSILRQAGFRSGDVVNSVNGRRISTVLQAITAYFALRRETEFLLYVTRRGEAILLTYHLRAADEMAPPRWEGHEEKSRTSRRPPPIDLDLSSLRRE